MKIKKRIVKEISDIVAACPYTIVGKRVFGKKESIEDKSQPIATQQEQQIIQGIKLGRNIALVGLFCPFFWIALFSRAPLDSVYFNAMHSGIVIAVGGAILIKRRIDLVRYKKTEKESRAESLRRKM